jgi:predicted nucleic acid-binding protein
VSDTVIDTCCLVNLCAIGDLRRFLPATGLTWYIPSAVASEAIRLYTPGSLERPGMRDVNLREYLAAGVATQCSVDTQQEVDLYVRLAVDLDDGEAMALALAKSRRWILATDDRKARRMSDALAVPVLTTTQIVRRWAERNCVGSAEVRQAIVNIQELARFVPRQSFPEYQWWMAQLASES